MNKLLLVWNIVITITLAMTVISGCNSTSMATEVQNNRALIEQVANLANSNRTAITSNTAAITKNTLNISNLQSTTEAAIAASQIALKQYVEQLVQAYMEQLQ
jgi:hypothetical protein